MTQQNSVNLTTPVGRIVQGSLYDPQTKDMDGKPLVIKSGPNAGQPTQRYYFALAIPKGPETHWALTEWGAKIWAVGHAAYPQVAQRPDFAWKIEDGDSTVPNKKNRRPCDNEGFKGNWVIRLSSGFAPRCFNANGTQALTEPGAIKCGYYAQVNINVAGNDTNTNPGVYLNHSMVALAGYGPEIVSGPDPASAGFGNAPLPAGASTTPVASFSPAPPATAVAPAPGAPPAPAPVAVPVVPVQPYTPPMTAAPPAPAPAAPPPPRGHAMTPKAAGVTYEAMVAAGWNDAALIQHGYMLP